MTRTEVLDIIPDLFDMRETKGFDVASQNTTFLRKPYHWYLTLLYDEQGKLQDAHVSTGNAWSGIFDQRASILK